MFVLWDPTNKPIATILVCTRPLHSQSLLSSEVSLSGFVAKTDLAKEFIDQLSLEWSRSSSYDSSEGSRWASIQLTPAIPPIFQSPVPAHRTHSYPQLQSGSSLSEVLAADARLESPINFSTPPFCSLVPRSFSDNAGLKLTNFQDKCLLSLESVLVASQQQDQNENSQDRLVPMRSKSTEIFMFPIFAQYY